MPAAEFKRIVSELSSIGDTVVIGVTKDGIKFSTGGDIGSANVMVRPSAAVDKPEEQTIIDMNEPVRNETSHGGETVDMYTPRPTGV